MYYYYYKILVGFSHDVVVVFLVYVQITNVMAGNIAPAKMLITHNLVDQTSGGFSFSHAISCLFVCVCVCVCVCACACVRACVRVRVRMRVCVLVMNNYEN